MGPSPYDVSNEAQDDLFDIWRRIADDSVERADRARIFNPGNS